MYGQGGNIHRTSLTDLTKKNTYNTTFPFGVTITIDKVADGVQRFCASMVAILHIAIFMTFDFYPSLIFRIITDSDLDRIKTIFGHKSANNWATELCK